VPQAELPPSVARAGVVDTQSPGHVGGRGPTSISPPSSGGLERVSCTRGQICMDGGDGISCLEAVADQYLERLACPRRPSSSSATRTRKQVALGPLISQRQLASVGPDRGRPPWADGGGTASGRHP